jgi:hypothetical protein
VDRYLPHLVISTFNFTFFFIFFFIIFIYPFCLHLPPSSLFLTSSLVLFHCFRHHNPNFCLLFTCSYVEPRDLYSARSRYESHKSGRMTSKRPQLLPFHFSVHSDLRVHPSQWKNQLNRPTLAEIQFFSQILESLSFCCLRDSADPVFRTV